MGLMQLAQPPTASFCHFANTDQEKKSEHRRREGEWGLEAGGERSAGGVALRGLRKGAGIQKENWSGQRKERKDRILKREKKRGRVLKRVKRAAPKEMKGESCWRGRGNKEEKVEGDRVRSSGGAGERVVKWRRGFLPPFESKQWDRRSC